MYIIYIIYIYVEVSRNANNSETNAKKLITRPIMTVTSPNLPHIALTYAKMRFDNFFEHTYPVFPTRPSLDGRARLDGRLGKIARLTPVFLWFCPSICDFGHIHERYWAVWQTGQQRFQRALNHKKTTKSLKPEFCPSLRPSNARIFVQKAPVFCPSFYKNEPVWRIGNTGHCVLQTSGALLFKYFN